MDGLKDFFDTPAADVAEVTLIGGTDGFGESIVVHIGNGQWLIVDCCINPITGQCLPLEYLKSINVDIKKQVRYIVCTHWHDDHIAGLSTLLSQCGEDTTFALSCAEDREKVVYELAQDFDYSGRSSVLKELTKSLHIAADNKIKIKRVEQDKLIFKKGKTQAFALSPSEVEVRNFETELVRAQSRFYHFVKDIKEIKQNSNELLESAEDIEKAFFESVDNLLTADTDVTKQTVMPVEDLTNFKDAKKVKPNNRCVAMLVSFGEHHIVLGADLEIAQIDTGWHSVLQCDCMNEIKANLFKIPHHGSETGYLKDFLETFIKKDATSKLTSWILGGSTLPKADMLKVYYNHTKNLYITTTKLLRFKNTESNPSIRKLMNSKTESICEIIPQLGIIRSRIKINEDKDDWTTVTFGSATILTHEHIKNLQ
ncbi:MAG: MBL fold metallo-hydrolase [Paludibacteraceae bacterium]|nr:MBL fold metallo-hydrolase [Paludibacteraceae bacterium]